MISNDEKVRAAIAEQAGDWLVASDEGPLDAQDAAALAAWLKTSPVHVEEFLGVSAVARDLRQARVDPEYALDAILARARAEDDAPGRALWPRVVEAVRGGVSGLWLTATVTMAAFAVLTLGWILSWNVTPTGHPSVSSGATALHYETRHGEQQSHRLADGSVLHLNTDSAATIRYGKNERLVTLTSGQADFDVAHDPDRAFRVIAGSAEVVDLGTKFDVHLQHDSTVVTVIEGRVAVSSSPTTEELRTGSNQSHARRVVQLGANQQISVTEGEWPATPVAVDAERTTAWLRREIVFDHEPLERVAAEYNRYTARAIEIATPALRNLQISGVFVTDDTEAFIAFLRSLKGVRVEVTETRIRVSRD
jgi:transmembrane sensor